MYQIQSFYEQFLRSDDLVFDIGANIGSKTEIFRNIGCKVISVEPHDSCIPILKNKFVNDSQVIILRKALGASAGSAQLITGEAACISSLSPEWVAAVTKTDRFGGYKWTGKQTVEVTTLDTLVSFYGVPAFIKIDVEGFEHKVLEGLSQPVKALSFEFTPEYLESAEKCIKHLEGLGSVEFAYSVKETTEIRPLWVSGKELLETLKGFVGDTQLYGDVYARFV